MEFWRAVDTGIRPAAQNISLSRALLEARAADETPSTLRFLRFAPCALIGCDRSAEQELDLPYCREQGIAVARRITGGSARYLDDAIGWELHLHRRELRGATLHAILRRVCRAAAAAVSALGVNARFRAGSDIAVDGRRIGVAASCCDRRAVLIEGTLFVALDPVKTLNVVRVPLPHWARGDSGIGEARARMAGLNDVLGRAPAGALIKRNLTEAFENVFDVEFRESDLMLSEHARYETALAGIGSPLWNAVFTRPAAAMPLLEAMQKCRGGRLETAVLFDTTTRVIRDVWFAVDFAFTPASFLPDLEAALRDTPVERLERRIRAFFGQVRVALPAITPDDFLAVVRRAVQQPLLASNA